MKTVTEEDTKKMELLDKQFSDSMAVVIDDLVRPFNPYGDEDSLLWDLPSKLEHATKAIEAVQGMRIMFSRYVKDKDVIDENENQT